MSKKKMIIRNCPAIFRSGTCGVKYQIKCKDCTDCVLKQIVEYCFNNDKYGDGYYTCPILELLDIQEAK